MEELVSSAPLRAATFFTLALALMTIGGLAIGDLEVGVRWGLRVAVVIGVFAYIFIKPTGDGTETPDE
jgi:hypothetical protein